MHPTIDSLAAFIERPEAPEFGDTRRHIALCGQCRRQVQGLSHLVDTLKSGTVALDESVTSDESGELEELMGKARHGQDKPALKAALHYATHSAAMRGHLQNSVRAAPMHNVGGGVSRAWRNLVSWRPHAWLALPMTAAAAFALAVVVLPSSGIHDKTLIAAYQDDANISFEAAADAPPGMGFFHGAGAKIEPFTGVQVKYDSASGLDLRWEPVAGAQQYTVRVALVEAQGPRVLAERDAAQSAVKFTALKLEAGRRYQWILSGVSAEGSRFHAGGGFVLANNE